MITLTPTQVDALKAFARDPLVPGWVNSEGVLYAYNGVSQPTAAALVRLGLAEWAPAPHGVTNPGLTGRQRYQIDWGIRLTLDGEAEIAVRHLRD